jgi:DNA-binding NarL/FixJ family response regulator
MLATIRLLLVDDHPVMRAGLANLLASEPGFDVAGQATDGLQGVRLWQELRPDVCLLDITMQGIDGIETLRRIRAADPTARVVMLTSSEAPEDLAQAVAAGALGYVTKNVEHDELVQAIRSAHAGRPVISSDMQLVAAQGSPAAPSPAAPSPAARLTPREEEVLDLLREGFTNNEIGRLLGISTRTAKAHVAAVIEKLDVVDRTQAVARGYELGLLRTSTSRYPRLRP